MRIAWAALIGFGTLVAACDYDRRESGTDGRDPLDANDASDGASALPTVPRLRAPAPGAYVGSITLPGSLRPTFVWEPSAADTQTITYELELATDDSFTANVSRSSTAATSFRPVADLTVSHAVPVGTRVYWRVRACAANACSPYSPGWWVNLGRKVNDLNGDGFADLVIGANQPSSGAGRAYVYLGGPGPFDTVPDDILSGAALGDAFGLNVAIAGDVNGDGFADLVVSSHTNSAGGMYAGRVYVYLGGAGASFDTTPDGTMTGTANEYLGGSVSSAGDVNGDGFADVIVGATRSSASGRAFLYFGGPGSVFDGAADATLQGEGADDIYGVDVASAGDVNADGFADVIVGADLNDGGGTNAGRAYVYLGGGAFDTAADWILTGAAPYDWFGSSVGSAGDVNGDGCADIVVGATHAADTGRAYVFLGNRGALDTNPDGVLTGLTTDDLFGSAAASAGDVNGDGFADVVVGALENFGGPGRAQVYLGGAGAAFEPTADGTMSGQAGGDNFGDEVRSVGDLNGDGFADVVVGAPTNDAAGTNAGRAYLFFGGVGATFDGTADRTFASSAQDYFGGSIAGSS